MRQAERSLSVGHEDSVKFLTKISEMLPTVTPNNGVQHFHWHMRIQEICGNFLLADYASAKAQFNALNQEIIKCLNEKKS